MCTVPALPHAAARFLTSFNADDCSSESERDGEALPDVDDSVEQAILRVGIWDHTLLLLQGLQVNTDQPTQNCASSPFVCAHKLWADANSSRSTHPEEEVRLDGHAHFLGALLHLREGRE